MEFTHCLTQHARRGLTLKSPLKEDQSGDATQHCLLLSTSKPHNLTCQVCSSCAKCLFLFRTSYCEHAPDCSWSSLATSDFSTLISGFSDEEGHIITVNWSSVHAHTNKLKVMYVLNVVWTETTQLCASKVT